MNLYAINIVTDTRAGDAFDAVAVNKFPILFKANSAEDLFEEEAFNKYIRSMIVDKGLSEKTKLYIRSLCESGESETFITQIRKQKTE